MNKIDLALQIATKAHAGQTDLDGEAVILHPLTVGLMGKTDEERMAGFLHDVIEDTDNTAEDLLKAGIPESVVNALRLLTHEEGMDYYDYVQRIIDSKNPIAIQVKFNDLTHNYSRGKAYPHLQKKHGKALEMVKPVIENMKKVRLYDASKAKESNGSNVKFAIFAAGCFWGVQHYFNKQNGVIRTFVGYTGGNEEYPTYEEVRSHHTHHVEAVLVEYNPDEVDYPTLVKLFFEIHDPSQTDGQGPDKGSQYLSEVFYSTEEELKTINELIGILRNKGYKVNTEVFPTTKFWIAEEYHQNYYENTGGSPYCHIRKKKF